MSPAATGVVRWLITKDSKNRPKPNPESGEISVDKRQKSAVVFGRCLAHGSVCEKTGKLGYFVCTLIFTAQMSKEVIIVDNHVLLDVLSRNPLTSWSQERFELQEAPFNFH